MATYTGSDKRLAYLFGRTEDMQGATASTDGAAGVVPAPTSEEKDLFLRGDGRWAEAGSAVEITPILTEGAEIATYRIGQTSGSLFAPNTLPGQGYTGSDLILRDAQGSISGVYYIDGEGNWVEYTKGGGSGHSFGFLAPNAASTITNSFSFEEVNT